MKEAVLPPPIEGLEGLYDEVVENPLLFATIAWKFTEDQRKAIKERDGKSCQFPEPKKGHGGSLEVHHIIPKSLNETTGIPVDNPLNGITVCRKCHNRIHEGAGHACTFETKRGEVVWNDTWDDQLITRALHNTREAIKKGWVFPK